MNFSPRRPLSTWLTGLVATALLASCSSTAAPPGDATDGAQSDASSVTAPDGSEPSAPQTGDDAVDGAPDTGGGQDSEAPLADAVTTEDIAAPQPDGADAQVSTTDGSAQDVGPQDTDPSQDTTTAVDGAAAEDTGDGEPGQAFCLFGGPACPAGEYCATGGCGLGLEGLCAPKPTDCAPSADSVCACDGNSYASACFAEQAGQHAIGPGPCPAVALNCDVDTTGGGFGSGCDVNEYCFGGCSGEGFCKERPLCGNSPGEVQCACNGLDYATPCTLASAGKNLAHVGWCGAPPAEVCGGPEELECSDPEAYCDLQSCQPEAEGICVTGVDSGEACPPNAPPECGCDDVTYATKCARILAGVAFKHFGPCGEGACELGTPGECGGGMYCAGPVGDCTGPGLCYPSPLSCDAQGGDNVPVCGCDGESFESLCHAYKADVPVASYGLCN
jgi:hypothetical protein